MGGRRRCIVDRVGGGVWDLKVIEVEIKIEIDRGGRWRGRVERVRCRR